MATPVDATLYRKLFCTLHRSELPVAPFRDIPHWVSPARANFTRGFSGSS